MAPGYEDADKRWRRPPPATVEAVLAAMAADRAGPPAATTLMLRLDDPSAALPSGRLTMEDGATLRVGGLVPPGLPPGYHRLEPDTGPPLTLVASPGRCPLPGAPAWGFSTQLYASRSRASWGIGDLDDLRRLGSWSAGLGASFMLVNPLNASNPTSPQQPSPYFPGSRCFLNPLYLAVERIPGPDAPDAGGHAVAGQALNGSRLIDRDRVWALKSAALESRFSDFAGDPGFAAYLAEGGAALQLFAVFCALSERHGGVWQSWPRPFRHPESPSVRAFAGSPVGSTRAGYHAWLQWHLDRQLQAAAAAIPVVSDLAVGVDPGGFDAWRWQDTVDVGMRIGAPPDRFNTLGQDWGLPPFDPWRLRAVGYDPWIQSIRGALHQGAGLRLDHVMGLFRLYWIPSGSDPSQGAYVHYPHRDLLDIVALEAHRVGAFVVGEDLGTVEAGVRQELSERRVLSYKVWWFQEDPPGRWPSHALGALSTHDLPTVAGVITGSDLEAQRRLRLAPNEQASMHLGAKLRDLPDYSPSDSVPAVIAKAYADLAEAPCLLLTASLDDALAVEERPNMPGTVDEWPNWRLALPRPLEELEELDLPKALAAALNDRAAGGGDRRPHRPDRQVPPLAGTGP